jgi:hypothetical protein
MGCERGGSLSGTDLSGYQSRAKTRNQTPKIGSGHEIQVHPEVETLPALARPPKNPERQATTAMPVASERMHRQKLFLERFQVPSEPERKGLAQRERKVRTGR